MENRPTKKQKELLNFIDGFIKGNGYGPSYREIMRALDYRSVSTVATHVDGLIARGWLVKKDNSARTLEVLAPKEGASAEAGLPTHPQTAEQEILAKLNELKDNRVQNADAITTLEKSLEILGYSHDTKVA